MNYKGFEGPIEELVRMKLRDIEEKEHVKILHAVESGSRAWGFASPDSDYDVRFIYVRPMEYYLRLEEKEDFIDWELDDVLDINGWDLSKCLRHIYKSNATVFEWANSPIVYYTTPEWEKIMNVANDYFSCKTAMYHYYGMANKNYHEYLTEEMVKYKKYFYVLRPILACKWIQDKACPPPVLFQTLVEHELDEDMISQIDELLSKKMEMSESDKGVRLDRVNEYIVRNMVYSKQVVTTMKEDKTNDWESLNQAFREVIYK